MLNWCAAILAVTLVVSSEAYAIKTDGWQMGRPIVTYYAGPDMTDAVAKQMAEGGWNVVWCAEKELDVALRHGLRAQLWERGILTPKSLDDPVKKAELDALIDRVKNHPAMYCYYIVDEPSAAQFKDYGRLVDYLRERDPAHYAYINLFPTYATNEQLGIKGETVAAYKDYLRRFVKTIKPALISYDHYHFFVDGRDEGQYFLNLAMIRRTALDAGVPFMNIVQACTFDKSVRAPNGDELRWLTYTSLAYGAHAISHFVYHYGPFYESFKPDAGQMMHPDGSPTELNNAAKSLNPEFEAIATQLQPLRSLKAYHAGMVPMGAEKLPAKAPFSLDPPIAKMELEYPLRGMLLGYFGPKGRRAATSHVVVVNLDYKKEAVTTLVGPRPLEVFDPKTGLWSASDGSRAKLSLPPGGGMLVRTKPEN